MRGCWLRILLCLFVHFSSGMATMVIDLSDDEDEEPEEEEPVSDSILEDILSSSYIISDESEEEAVENLADLALANVRANQPVDTGSNQEEEEEEEEVSNQYG